MQAPKGSHEGSQNQVVLMKKVSLLFTVVSLATLLTPSSSPAQQRSFITRDAGPYFRFDLGPTFTEDGRLTELGSGSGGNEVRYDTGFTFDASAGYAFNNWVAAELQLGTTWNEIDSVEGVRMNDTFLFNVPIMANVILQWPIPRTRLVPYLGGGVGGSTTVFDTDGFDDGVVTLVGSDSDFVFAWQGFAGLRFEINERMFLGLAYKYLATGDSSYEYEALFGGPDFDLGIEGTRSHTVTFSFSMKF